jgi:glycosyltransferase involved in cell wall biosynthesis
MKILYDISVLGMGHYQARAKTGIFRVVENIACGLADSEECLLSFCSSLSLANLNQTIDYLEANPAFENIPLIFPESPKSIYKNISVAIKKINGQPKVGFRLKVFRRTLYYSLRLLEKTIKPLNIKELSAADLFHSPFHPFPEYINAAKNTKKFITIYDLIPILYPKFFEFDENHLIKKVVHSLELNDWVVCISDSTKNDLCNYRNDIDPSRVFVTRPAASELFYPCGDLGKINSVKKKYRIPDVPYILSLSTLEPRKNIAHTIRCFAKLVEQENIKDLSLVLVGTKGWSYYGIFEELSKISSLKNRVIITGFVADEDLAALYSGAVAFIYPSFYEGFGLPPLEAMQCGVPVITSDTSSLPEVVGEAGIMVSPIDADALCQSMLEIYNSDSLRETISLKSIEQAKKFSWQRCTRETINAYKTALKS